MSPSEDWEKTEELVPAVGRGVHIETESTACALDVAVPVKMTITRSATIDLAIALRAYAGVSHLMVVSESGKFEGLVTAHDLLEWVAVWCGYTIPPTDHHAIRLCAAWEPVQADPIVA